MPCCFFWIYPQKGGSLGAYQCFMHSLDASVRLWPDQRTLWWRSLLGLGGPVGLEEMPQMTSAEPHSKTFNKFEAGWMNYHRSLEEQEVHWNRCCSLFCLERCFLLHWNPWKLTPQSSTVCNQGEYFWKLDVLGFIVDIISIYILAFSSGNYDDMKWIFGQQQLKRSLRLTKVLWSSISGLGWLWLAARRHVGTQKLRCTHPQS